MTRWLALYLIAAALLAPAMLMYALLVAVAE